MTAEDVRVVHFTPGRVRVKIDRLKQNRSLADTIEQLFSSLEGVEKVRASALTGSVLVQYDPDISLDSVAAAVRSLGLPEFDLTGVDLSRLNPNGQKTTSDLSTNIQHLFRSVNHRVAEATGGTSDLKGLIPVGFFLLGVRALLAGSREAIPWYNFFWFAFGAFTTLNPPARNDTSSRGQEASS